MKTILVTYATNSGSTAEVAQAVCEELLKSGSQVEILPVEKVNSLENYAAVVLGAPMILGWHRLARRFLRQNRSALEHLPLAVFVTCMSLTRTGETHIQGVPVIVDEHLPKPPRAEKRLRFKERYSLLSNYLRPIFKTSPVKPVSIGVFAGQLNYARMKLWAMIFVVLILQAQAGDKRNWDAIRAWAGSLPALLNTTTPKR
jgi:menaquinone-dependent protoporphyrinogen oxidase